MVLHHTVNPLCNARSIFVLSLSGSMIFYKKSSFTSSMSGEKALPGHYVTRGGSSIWRNAGSECFLAYLINWGNKRRGPPRGGGAWG